MRVVRGVGSDGSGFGGKIGGGFRFGFGDVVVLLFIMFMGVLLVVVLLADMIEVWRRAW